MCLAQDVHHLIGFIILFVLGLGRGIVHRVNRAHKQLVSKSAGCTMMRYRSLKQKKTNNRLLPERCLRPITLRTAYITYLASHSRRAIIPCNAHSSRSSPYVQIFPLSSHERLFSGIASPFPPAPLMTTLLTKMQQLTTCDKTSPLFRSVSWR